MSIISFFSNEIEFALTKEGEVSNWLMEVVAEEHQTLSDLNVIFMSDDQLLEINKKFLNHDYYTDVITFPGYGEVLSGEIYISIDRVKENAEKLSLTFNNELHRVILHGLLHILGYNDKSNKEIIANESKGRFLSRFAKNLMFHVKHL